MFKFIKKKFFMKPAINRNECPDCGGKMEDTGVAYMTMPAQYEYVCKECGKKVVTTTHTSNEALINIIDENIEG